MTTATESIAAGFIGRIPVRNIWLLLLYASQLYRELPETQRVELEEAPDDIPELVAELLANAVDRRIRRNLTVGYRRRSDVLNRVRGRIDLLRTERGQLLQRGQVACRFDELTIDTPRNHCVKEALLLLAKIVKREPLERRCRELAARLGSAGVRNEPDAHRVSGHILRSGAGWTDAEERQMLAAARLAFDLAIPTEQSGNALLAMADRDANPGWKLYEHAVAGFYEAVLRDRGWDVYHGRHMSWHLEQSEPSVRDLMPQMITDITLERRPAGNAANGRRIVIDTKFMSPVTSGQQGKQTFRSGNIYQMYAYLRSQEDAGDLLWRTATGVLLYPSLGVDYDEAATIQGHRVRFATVDLAVDAPTIRRQLLRIADEEP
ncbi:MAG: 5-methylcytosine-specific restriction endonuclease system specificity protein McrC [Chloroflexota bacterium]|nr:5-methylcytosine-specific restriction endonuclease system specificity protein McrC [Chloroflexota bacterium]MDE2959533.1 5-methylcytosine-specific restriction endonuclease system specificity protein McrC [Chloroflexota bacterium]